MAPLFLHMKKALSILWLVGLTAGLSLSQPVTPKKSPQAPVSKKTAAKTTKAVGKATAPTARKTTARKTTARSGKKSSLPRTPVRVRQAAPTPDRYREIQAALAARGYLQQEPTGVWNAQSSDALKQFQTETNLSPTGRLSALTLIGLGLGPRFSDTQAAISPVLPPPVDSADPPAQN